MDSLVRDAFHRLVTLAELASISVAHRVRERFDSRRPFTRRFRFGLVRPGRLSAATKSTRTGPAPPTDFCNRQRAWAHRLDGSLLATEPAVSAHSAVPRNGTASGTASGANAPFARGQGRHRPAGLRVSVHDGACRGPLATNLPSTRCRSPRVPSRSGRPEATSCEPRPGSIRRANGEDLHQTEVLSTAGNPRGS